MATVLAVGVAGLFGRLSFFALPLSLEDGSILGR